MSVNAALRAALERHMQDLAPARRLRMLLAPEALARFADGRPIEVLDAGCEVAAERRGLTWGEPRAWFVTARKAP